VRCTPDDCRSSPRAQWGRRGPSGPAPFRVVPGSPIEEQSVKVRPSVKPMCEKCRVIKRHGKVLVICVNPRHKQTQG